jgi:hypothetical protein
VLRSGEPNFPFCLAWANQTWTGIWHGAPNRILIEQTYPGVKDYESHFYTLLDAFSDDRYITIEGKPVFLVFDPQGLPDPKRFTDCWRKLAIKSGLKGLYFIGNAWSPWIPTDYNFDASIKDNLGGACTKLQHSSRNHFDRICKKLTSKDWRQLYRKVFSKPAVYLYKDIIKHALPPLEKDFDQYPCVIPNWDNTPRSGVRGFVFHNSTPELFRLHLKEAIMQICERKHDKRIVFIKSWNEWAEGNYLEPDQKFAKAYLEVIKQEMSCNSIAMTPTKLERKAGKR